MYTVASAIGHDVEDTCFNICQALQLQKLQGFFLLPYKQKI